MDFTKKARWVKDSYRIHDPVGSIYAEVVSREIFCIALICAALNGIRVNAAGIKNVYLQSPLQRNTT